MHAAIKVFVLIPSGLLFASAYASSLLIFFVVGAEMLICFTIYRLLLKYLMQWVFKFYLQDPLRKN